jgi:5'-3' exonuclease
MGVPGFFLWLIKKYKNDYFFFNKNSKKYDVSNINAIMIDANCALHPQCFKALAKNKKITDKDILESEMIKECIAYLKYIIDFVDPSNLIYIAVDGVAPSAKLKQQRMRRFKSVKEKALHNSIKKKHNKPIDTQWNNSAITPGTDFMDRITSSILQFIKETDFGDREVIFSSANTPGEGEHKLLQYIYNTKNDYNYVIYGLDADLIFLALSASEKEIFLVREENSRNSNANNANEVLQYVSINTLKECIFREISELLCVDDIDIELDEKSVIRDFVFICYFLGNDFLPHIPSIDIKCYDRNSTNGLDLLLQAYSHVFDNIHDYIMIVNNDGKITYNKVFLSMFLEYLSSFESEFFFNLSNAKRYFGNCKSRDPYEQEIHRINNLKFKIKNDVNLGKGDPDEWKFRYYKKYYFTESNQEAIIQTACKRYFEGLVWVANYYFDECPSWNWYYPFDHAPFISDLATNFKRFDMDKATFEKGNALRPIEQLLSVLPPQSNFLLPNKYKWLMTSPKSPIIHLYPQDYDLDMLYKRQYWQCIPILPELEIDNVKQAVKSIKPDEADNKKNKIMKPYMYS